VPIFNKDISIPNNVQLWNITESWTELIQLFENDLEINAIIHNTKNESKKQQYLASRLLLKKTFGNWKTLSNPNGKPQLINNESEISISHDKKFAGLINSERPCGIDIQEVSLKVTRIKNKFVNDKDLFSSSIKEKDLTILWCAKEALYKINGDPNIFFKEHMIIEETLDQNVIIGKIIHPDYRQDYKMKVHFIENYCLVYTL